MMFIILIKESLDSSCYSNAKWEHCSVSNRVKQRERREGTKWEKSKGYNISYNQVIISIPEKGKLV